MTPAGGVSSARASFPVRQIQAVDPLSKILSPSVDATF